MSSTAACIFFFTIILPALLGVTYIILYIPSENVASGSRSMCTCPNACQTHRAVTKPPPVTDASIVDYYYNYHYPNGRQTDSEVIDPPSSTAESSRHDTSYSSRSRHKKMIRVLCSGTSTPARPAASDLTSAPSSGSSSRVPQPMNIGRPRASILKSVYMTSSASRIPRPINWDRLHCRSRPKKVTFGETRVIRVEISE